ncbi:MAG: SHOCT domain-containing protein [SAR202 cluster bacterium]|jgi:putative membrane protein|nr:SHOCT domain-containing protein [SAR202 cluster bacterium]MDP6512529.1 SHOCT domain-containing protein [SAR202 cluster bacterium]MDP6714318.1 SHOCT domain-containing protein [SAR202 cluster bacterium]
MGPDSMGGSGMWIIFPIIMIPIMLTFMYMMFMRGGQGPPWRNSGSHDSANSESETASDILRTRYARGEITKEQFDQMSQDLSTH